MKKVLILGAGFAGLELATTLSEEVPEDVEVTVIDQNDSFVFGFSKLDVMFGRAEPGSVRLAYSRLSKPAVKFRRERVQSIDAGNKRVTTDTGTYEPDVLVVALGADLDPAATPGLLEGGSEYYSVSGAERVRSILPDFPGGDVVISVLGPFFKCPAAPFETALMMYDYLEKRGRMAASSVKVISPMAMPIPISPEASAGILKALEERDIGWWPQSKVTTLDPATKTATLVDGRTASYDLFLGIPVHRAPRVVEESDLVEDGWIPVDHTTFATRFADVYAVGDVTSAPVPRVGVMAQGEARTVAEGLIHQIRGGDTPPPFQGLVTCYIEFGGPKVARFDANFLGGPNPVGMFTEASEEMATTKREWAATQRQRWFGPNE